VFGRKVDLSNEGLNRVVVSLGVPQPSARVKIGSMFHVKF